MKQLTLQPMEALALVALIGLTVGIANVAGVGWALWVEDDGAGFHTPLARRRRMRCSRAWTLPAPWGCETEPCSSSSTPRD